MLTRGSDFMAADISSEADIESLESYEDQIHHYEDLNYTYIPIPSADKYYNTEEGWLRDLNKEQYIKPSLDLLKALDKLQREPFLLIDSELHTFVIYSEEEGVISIGGSTNLPEGPSGQRQAMVDAGRDPEEIREYTWDEFVDSHPDLAQEKYASKFENRYEIITLADVNKRGVNEMLYRFIAKLESNLAGHIEKQHPDSKSILKYVNPNPIGRWKKENIRGLNLHIAEHLNLIDIMSVIQASDKEFVTQCGFDSKSDVQTLNSINKIRNKVMHTNRSLVYERKDIEEILDMVEESKRIIRQME
jgi:hypothetical protein